MALHHKHQDGLKVSKGVVVHTNPVIPSLRTLREEHYKFLARVSWLHRKMLSKEERGRHQAGKVFLRSNDYLKPYRYDKLAFNPQPLGNKGQVLQQVS